MNVKRIISIAVAMLVMSFVVPVYANAQAPPSLPHSFYGALEVNGSDAEPGYEVKAEGPGVATGIEGNPITTQFLGEYGRVGPLQPRVIVQGDIEDGAEIEFYVSSDGVTWVKAETEPAPVGWHSGEKSRVDLTVDISVTPVTGGGGGGGGAPRDTTPPILSNILASSITETTADICWETNEPGTTQVEWWSSPSTLSPLDETMTYSHLVHLTDLTPGTTYHYKTMSKDAAGNVAVSDEETFTTEGEAPAEPEPAPAPPPEPPAPAPPAPPPPPTPPPPEVEAAINWPVVGGVIAGVIVVGLIIFFVVRRRAY